MPLRLRKSDEPNTAPDLETGTTLPVSAFDKQTGLSRGQRAGQRYDSLASFIRRSRHSHTPGNMTDEILQNAGHQLLVKGQCIAQSKWHRDHFVEPDVRYNSCLLNVDQFERHLVINHRQVETAEHSGFCKRVKCFIESGQRK